MILNDCHIRFFRKDGSAVTFMHIPFIVSEIGLSGGGYSRVFVYM